MMRDMSETNTVPEPETPAPAEDALLPPRLYEDVVPYYNGCCKDCGDPARLTHKQFEALSRYLPRRPQPRYRPGQALSMLLGVALTASASISRR